MPGRTFAIGDIHGDIDAVYKLLASFPELTTDDTLVFVGDYIDRGPSSKEVIDYVRRLPGETPAKVVALRGNHEDAWLRVIDRGWPEFILPPSNGCLATLRSYTGTPQGDEPGMRNFLEKTLQPRVGQVFAAESAGLRSMRDRTSPPGATA